MAVGGVFGNQIVSQIPAKNMPTSGKAGEPGIPKKPQVTNFGATKEANGNTPPPKGEPAPPPNKPVVDESSIDSYLDMFR
jgi:hypothetical protein